MSPCADRSRAVLPLVILALIVLCAGPAAAVAYIRTQAEVQLFDISNSQTGYVGSSSAAGSGAWDDPDGSRHSIHDGAALATAGYGTLAGSSTSNASTIWLGTSYVASTEAWFQDVLTITGGTPGALGSLSMPVQMSGSYDVMLDTMDYVSWGLTFPGLSQNGGVGYTLPNSANLDQSTVATVGFRFGQPLTLYCNLSSRAATQTDYAALVVRHTTVQLSAAILGITEVRDNAGTPLASFNIVSESGTDYTTPTPQASTTWGSVKALFR